MRKLLGFQDTADILYYSVCNNRKSDQSPTPHPNTHTTSTYKTFMTFYCRFHIDNEFSVSTWINDAKSVSSNSNMKVLLLFLCFTHTRTIYSQDCNAKIMNNSRTVTRYQPPPTRCCWLAPNKPEVHSVTLPFSSTIFDWKECRLHSLTCILIRQ